jgi:hypothetical protein
VSHPSCLPATALRLLHDGTHADWTTSLNLGEERPVVGDRPVPENLRMSVWSLRRYRALRFAVNGEPARKGRSGSRAAISLQRQVMDQMEAWRRFPMTGPVPWTFISGPFLRGPRHP